METITTTDLSKFGARERQLAEILLRAWRVQGLPEDFTDEEVTIMLNTNSGCVFLTNSEFQAVMFNGDKLEIFYYCPNCGNEGFEKEIMNDGKCKQCGEQIK
ncbi:MAG: hypothetical protein HQL12_05775 [Candidatus Omnitrophica bacterium]|nr:hypothetical protein [Candidatus Omnitrophota bacterium]